MHHVVSAEELRRIISDSVEWASRTVEQLDLLEEWWEESERQTRSSAGDSSHRLVGNGATSPLEGAVLVPLDDRPAPPLLALAGWRERAGAVRRHRAQLRAALSELVRFLDGVPRRRLLDPQVIEATEAVRRLEDWATKTGFGAALSDLLEREPASATAVLKDSPRAVAIGRGWPVPRGEVAIFPATELDLLRTAAERAVDLLAAREALRTEVIDRYEAVSERMLERRLRELSLSTLKDASGGSVRIGPLEDAGITDVWQVLENEDSIALLPGIGQQSAYQLVATARRIRIAAQADLRLRIDLDESDQLLTALVTALHRLLEFEARVHKHRDELARLAVELEPLRATEQVSGPVMVLHPHSPRRGRDVARLMASWCDWIRESGLLASLDAGGSSREQAADAWADFKRRAAEYYGLLGETVGITTDVDAAQGHLPQEVAEAVHRQMLNTDGLKASLRGYQDFGARYALVQRRVLLGDEMGLGKTVQALAAMTHLEAGGARHFLVVCPSAVLVNWSKEVRKHTYLEPLRVHGPAREQAWERWQRRGGVAITSFDTLWRLSETDLEPDLLVVDEAHLVKNPDTKRGRAVADFSDHSDRVLFMTGTPLENRVEEFHSLVHYLQPDVVADLDAAEMVLGAHKFRAAVAPVYLRRNSADVLAELPELVETEEWVSFTRAEEDAYLDAVTDGAFQSMRRVAFVADPGNSSKLERLEEIVDEAQANGLKTVVFSYFRDVVDVVAERLGDRVIGSITGSTSGDRRQQLADQFTESPDPSVLVSQVQAGGVGMNLQAASVVILCEPQVKPTLEDQAIKRAHRMGQVRTVQVHRLLTEDSVDERMLEILAQKSAVFDEYVGESDVAAVSPEALDVTETKLAREVLAREQQRLVEALRARHAPTAVRGDGVGGGEIEAGDVPSEPADAPDGPSNQERLDG